MNKWLFLIFLFFPQHLSEHPPHLFVVWDVGQGLWSTIVSKKLCLHFDMGGEYFRHSAKLIQYCGHKKNQIALSHMDHDHIRFVQKINRRFDVCIVNKHQLPIHTSIKNIASCRQPKDLEQMYTSTFSYKNESHVYSWKNEILAPGDAYKKQERRLAQNNLTRIRFLLVGHHGSKTSSDKSFIASLPKLKQALVSARKPKYGHPHIFTRDVFKKNKIPLIETHVFGTLIYEY